ncbi:type III secretion apparatus protein, YscR/HrcR family [Roseibium sp. TrichSKD4]|uniref:type III secretion system export apparatus subunit SctR n=1 Tax=Roseibium sp. TrichSKD4 TaxID=744980 RepID=UPI0001E56A90|nr:type III secretion system export apparatus subunit SctR [Roseibium sp. TrichSKD4]EFO31932.1 type III secretion apparatus protein, YscR/HrcR family [Roseibium sp. TrichSKD4]
MNEFPQFLGMLILASIVPFFIVGTTAFIKIATILFILRNAIGLQQTPPNMALYAITLALVAFIQAPVFVATYDILAALPIDFNSPASLQDAFVKGLQPISDFMNKHVTLADKTFFLDAGNELYKGSRLKVTENSFLVLLPAFMNAELNAALQAGVLIFLPFLAIDIVVTNILSALGMSMVSPMVISLPFKVLLFVAADGWSKLTHSLILSYI